MLYETAGSRGTAIVHDITISDHISYIEWVNVGGLESNLKTFFMNSHTQKVLRGFKFTVTFKTRLKPV